MLIGHINKRSPAEMLDADGVASDKLSENMVWDRI
jgi:hypothetical protein